MGTYRDYLRLRRGGGAPPPDPHGGTRYYADADGVLRAIQSDGDDAPVGGGGGGSISVTDGSTTVDPATSLDFSSGGTVTDGGGGVAEVSVGGSTPVQPSDIPGLALWLDAAQIVGLSDGDPVALWPDASPNGFDGAQAVAVNQPVYKTAIQNGLPVVRFDGADIAESKWLDLAAGALGLLNAKPGCTMFYVIGNETAYVDYASTLYLSRHDDNAKPRFYANDAHVAGAALDADTLAWDTRMSELSYGDLGSAFNPALGVQFTTPAFAPTIMRVDLAGGGVLAVRTSSAEMLAGLIDPTIFSTVFSNPKSDSSVVAAWPATDSLIARIGETEPVGGGYGLVGDIAEIGFYDRCLNSLETRQLMEGLSAKWATV